MRKTNEITIIGFGNQAQAWALNLRDSGLKVNIGLRNKSQSLNAVAEMGFDSFIFDDTQIPTHFFALLIPDDQHEDALKIISKKNPGKTCLYAHGYSLGKFGLHKEFPEINHILLAPKSIASELRFLYETKGNLTGFYSLEHVENFNFEELSCLASSLGLKNIFPTTFQEETQADLFSEQSLLCALLPYGILETFNTLIDKGYSKELAFYESFYESKLILDTIFKVGPENFFNLISPNALIGSEVGKNLLIDEGFKQKLRKILTDIEEDNFQETINKTDITQLREDITAYWKAQPLSQVYQELKGTL